MSEKILQIKSKIHELRAKLDSAVNAFLGKNNDEVIDSVDVRSDYIKKDCKRLSSLIDSFNEFQKDTNALIEEIETLLPVVEQVVEQDKKRRSDLLNLRLLKGELLAIHRINKKTADSIENQLDVSKTLMLKIQSKSV